MGLEHVCANAHAFRSVKGQWPQISTGQAVFLNYGNLGCVKGIVIVGHVHAKDMSRTEEAFGMLGKTEDGCAAIGLVGAHTLEHAQSVMQGVCQYMNLSLTPGDHCPIEPDTSITI